LDEFDRELTTWGVSQAPLIYKDFVIVAPQGKEGGVVAFHKKQERNYGSIPD
jgi:ABC-type tungstate transport system permease subunit